MNFLKNYTSSVPVSETIRRIEAVLIRCGVTGIMKEYVGTSGKISAITFRVKTEGVDVAIRLPANEEQAINALWLNYADGDKLSGDGQRLAWSPYKKKKRADFVEQGERTAWKIIQDWIEVQMSMVQMKQADILQVFLPYQWNGRQTYYEALKESNFRGLLPEKTSDAEPVEAEVVA